MASRRRSTRHRLPRSPHSPLAGSAARSARPGQAMSRLIPYSRWTFLPVGFSRRRPIRKVFP